jgi:hypothetical protein
LQVARRAACKDMGHYAVLISPLQSLSLEAEQGQTRD